MTSTLADLIDELAPEDEERLRLSLLRRMTTPPPGFRRIDHAYVAEVDQDGAITRLSAEPPA